MGRALRCGATAYLDRWRDYSKLDIVRGDAFGNAERSELFEYVYALDKLVRLPDRAEWWITPQTVNALNLPVQNALNFPAAILEPPFYDGAASAAVRYGAIGAIIGQVVMLLHDPTLRVTSIQPIFFEPRRTRVEDFEPSRAERGRAAFVSAHGTRISKVG